MQFDFSEKTVVITGGTGGIGSAMANCFTQTGARVIVTGTQQEQIDAFNETSSPIQYRWLDFMKKSKLENALSFFENQSRIDILINNAGVNQINSVDEVSLADWDWMQTINLRGIHQLTNIVSKVMKRQLYGKILNISSIFGVVSKAQRAVYSSTKWGLIGYTKGVALDLAPYNILVNALSPGFVNTKLTRRILSETEKQTLSKQVPLLRFAEPEEIAKIALFLTSDWNTYITGQNIIVDGGFVSQ